MIIYIFLCVQTITSLMLYGAESPDLQTNVIDLSTFEDNTIVQTKKSWGFYCYPCISQAIAESKNKKINLDVYKIPSTEVKNHKNNHDHEITLTHETFYCVLNPHVCDYQGTSGNALIKHIKRVHNEKKNYTKAGRLCYCYYCIDKDLRASPNRKLPNKNYLINGTIHYNDAQQGNHSTSVYNIPSFYCKEQGCLYQLNNISEHLQNKHGLKSITSAQKENTPSCTTTKNNPIDLEKFRYQLKPHQFKSKRHISISKKNNTRDLLQVDLTLEYASEQTIPANSLEETATSNHGIDLSQEEEPFTNTEVTSTHDFMLPLPPQEDSFTFLEPISNPNIQIEYR